MQVIMDSVNIKKNAGSFTPNQCAMNIWKGAVKTSRQGTNLQSE